MRTMPLSQFCETLPDETEYPLMVPCDPETGAVLLDDFSLSLDGTQQAARE